MHVQSLSLIDSCFVKLQSFDIWHHKRKLALYTLISSFTKCSMRYITTWQVIKSMRISTRNYQKISKKRHILMKKAHWNELRVVRFILWYQKTTIFRVSSKCMTRRCTLLVRWRFNYLFRKVSYGGNDASYEVFLSFENEDFEIIIQPIIRNYHDYTFLINNVDHEYLLVKLSTLSHD